MFFKNKILEVILLLIMGIAIFFCGSTLMKYTSKGNIIQNQMLISGVRGTETSENKVLSFEEYENLGLGYGEANCSGPLVIYSIMFFSLAIGIYFIIKYKNIKIDIKNQKYIIFTAVVVGISLRFALGLIIEGFAYDVYCFKTWGVSASQSLTNFYSGGASSDYPPFYLYVLYFVGKLISIPKLSVYSNLLVKLPSIFADIVTAYIIYKISKRYISSEVRLCLFLFYIFNPAIFINSTLWGQVDSFFTMIIILGVYLITESKVGLATMLFAIAVLMKPQGIIYCPILFFEVVRKKDVKLFFKMTLIAIGTFLVIIAPFSLHQSPLWIFKLYLNTISEYPMASVNAFNFFALIGGNQINHHSTLFVFSYHMYGMFFIVLTTLLSWFIYARGNSRKNFSVAALIQISGVFTFSTGMHERYLFPAVALAILAYIYIKDKRFSLLAMGFSVTIFLNTYDILSGNNAFDQSILVITSLLNILLFIYLIKVLWDVFIRKNVVYKLDVFKDQ